MCLRFHPYVLTFVLDSPSNVSLAAVWWWAQILGCVVLAQAKLPTGRPPRITEVSHKSMLKHSTTMKILKNRCIAGPTKRDRISHQTAFILHALESRNRNGHKRSWKNLLKALWWWWSADIVANPGRHVGWRSPILPNRIVSGKVPAVSQTSNRSVNMYCTRYKKSHKGWSGMQPCVQTQTCCVKCVNSSEHSQNSETSKPDDPCQNCETCVRLMYLVKLEKSVPSEMWVFVKIYRFCC